ncbi:histidine kinase [Roseateles koreensis]|uniref:histidine kinase n=1 Tax=Roseateles koreensis TaxID=2987526 RepID=A0ABT5KQ54_9BURK|nr:histidine kinase [Roseateles koreensis]MDC8784981.1 histidine kinase [Roseateles koreensis]
MNAGKTLTNYERWQRFSQTVVQGFHVYANWLVGISWRRFVVLAIALIIAANILQELPPFTWRINHQVVEDPIDAEEPPAPPTPTPAPAPAKTAKPQIKLDKPLHYEINIDEKGVRIAPSDAANSKPAASAASDAAASAPAKEDNPPAVHVDLPPGANAAQVKQAIEEAKQAIEEAIRDARDAAQESAREAQQAERDAAMEAQRASHKLRNTTTVVRLGDYLVNLAVLFVLASAVIKITYKGRIQAEVKAAQATETAEAESLKRQVVEARMAAMQAQVEPHFLFNTLASIDHLIETDPPRASIMQKNLIALLRASMPTMREANASGVRDLGRELAVIRPYLEILKVRMEERLQTVIDVPDGLLSAEFPPMMIQSLVENAIKHGLEPKAEGGSLKVKAEIVHGKLAVSVADTGLGFGRAATAGTGVGLANIRERLSLLHGAKASVSITENKPSGCIVTLSVPYRSCAQDEGSQA